MCACKGRKRVKTKTPYGKKYKNIKKAPKIGGNPRYSGKV